MKDRHIMLGKMDNHHKSMKLERVFPPYSKINSKWLTDLHKRHNTIKLLEENICKTLFDINHSMFS